MNYTSEEILNATTLIVRDAVRRPYGVLGNRDTSITFSDLQDAAAGVYLLFLNAPFYTVFLGTERLGDLVDNEAELLAELIELVENIGRNVTAITSLTPLANAGVALSALESAVSDRSSTFIDIEQVPAFKRFDANLQRFLDESSKNIKRNGVVVPTPAQSRAELPAKITSLKLQHTELIRRATLLEGALDDFNSLQLRATLQSAIMTQAKSVLDANLALLESKTPSERLEDIRAVTLDILVARSIIRGFGSLSGPTTFALIDGTGSAFADSAHLATPAQISADVLGPYAIFPGNQELDFFLDGDTSVTTTVQLAGSFVAAIASAVAERYDIVAATNDSFDIAVTDEVTLTVPLTAGSTQTAQDIADDINAAITTEPIVAEPTFLFSKFNGGVIASLTPNTFTFLNDQVDPTALGVLLGDKVRVRSGDNVDNLYLIAAITPPAPPTPASIEVILVTGAHVVATNDIIDIADTLEFVSIRINDAGRAAALQLNKSISLPATPATIEKATLETLGFLPDISSVSRRTPVVDQFDVRSGLLAGLETIASTSIAGSTRIQGSRDIVAAHFTGSGRTDPTTSLKYILFTLRTAASIVSTTLGVTTITVPSTTGAAVGEVVVLREAAVEADINKNAVITSLTATTIVATFASPPTDTTNKEIEVGPNLSLPNDTKLVLTGNTINDGEYDVSFSGATFPNSVPFELPLIRPVVSTSSGGFLPIINTAVLGQERITFASTDETLITAIRANDGTDGGSPNASTAYDEFFTATPATGEAAVGTTAHFLLPEDPRTLEVDDVLELYTTNYSVPSSTFVLAGLELSRLLIEVTPELDTDLPSFLFTSSGLSIPFARIRKTQRNNFGVLEAALDTWSELSENEAQFFPNLDALLNPLLSNANPTIVQVNDAKIVLQSLLAVVATANEGSTPALETVLDAYQTSDVAQVDALISAFTEKGANRAIDLLLEGRFTTFFGLTTDGLSYAGDVLAKVKEIQRQDLPVRKVRRDDAFSDTLIASYEEPDFEFDQSDIEDIDEVNPPGGFAQDFPGSVY